MKKANLKTMVRSAYDMQDLRIRVGNRLVANCKAKLGQEPSQKEETIDADGKRILKDLRNAHKRITDSIANTFIKLTDFPGDEVISDYGELHLVGYYLSLVKAENDLFKAIEQALSEYKIWTEYLIDVKGIGRAMAGVIISEFDIHEAKYPSSLWAYSGMDVGPDGAGRSRRKEHLRTIEYKDKNGKPATRVGVTFNPFLKTKLLGVLAPSFLRIGVEKSPWAAVYYDYKHRMENHALHGIHNDKVKDENDRMTASKGHRHNMAMRYMIKMFLIELYTKWRGLEGLEVSLPYSEAKLQMKKHGT